MKVLLILIGFTGLNVILRIVIAPPEKLDWCQICLLLQKLYLNYQIKGSKL